MNEEPQVVMYVRCIPNSVKDPSMTELWGEVNPIHIPRVGEYITFSVNGEAMRYVVRDVVWFYRIKLPVEVTVFAEKHYM